MVFLQDLKTGLKTAQLELDNAKRTNKDTFLAESKVLALTEIWNYIKSGVWYSNPATVEKVVALVENNKKDVMAKYGITESHCNTILWRANDCLAKKFPNNIVTRVLQGDINSAMLEFRCQSGTLLSRGAFLQEANELLPAPDDSVPFKLGDCVNEAKLLSFYSRAVMLKRFGAVDKQKLAYLVHLLNTYNSALEVEQRALYHVINGDASANTLSEVNNPLNPVYSDLNEDVYVPIE